MYQGHIQRSVYSSWYVRNAHPPLINPPPPIYSTDYILSPLPRTTTRLITPSKANCHKMHIGIQETSFSLDLQIVRIKGTEPPSKIIKVIEETGRNAILRGSGENGVCMFSPKFTQLTAHSSILKDEIFTYVQFQKKKNCSRSFYPRTPPMHIIQDNVHS